MMRKEKLDDSALPEVALEQKSGNEKERMLKYKTFSLAFAYPDDKFFSFFPQLLSEKERLILEYDQLFRTKQIWLYTTEYLAENEFQRSNYLADIAGFYRAFGLETDKERPDAIDLELEFMYFLIFKTIYAKVNHLEDYPEKISLCFQAQKEFFIEYLYPAAKIISQKIISQIKDSFYKDLAEELLLFLEAEKSKIGS